MRSHSITDHSVYGIQTYGSVAPHDTSQDPSASYEAPSPPAADIELLYDAADTLAR